MVRQGGSETTVRIELKQRMDDGGWTTADVRIELKRQMANGGCQTAVLAVVNIATVVLCSPFDCGCGGALSSSNHGCRCRGLVVSLPPSSSCGGALLDPDGNDDKDNDNDEDDDDYEDDGDCSHQDRTTGMWALRRMMSTITRTPMHQRLQAGLRQRRKHQQQRGGGGRRNDGGTTGRPIPKATNHAPRLSLPLMLRKPRCHRRRHRWDRG